MSRTTEHRTRREKVEDREHAIVTAAREVFIESGYDGARMVEIARRAGIAEGTIYIYYKTKADLMRAIVSSFWADLTKGARKAVSGTGETYESLRALADFHMTALIERMDLIILAQTLPRAEPDASSTLEELRAYVAIFDEIFQRGIDRGVFSGRTPIWIARDLFYGTLEYSARTILLRDGLDPADAVKNMVEVFRARFGQLQAQADPATADVRLTRRLENAVERLERLTNQSSD